MTHPFITIQKSTNNYIEQLEVVLSKPSGQDAAGSLGMQVVQRHNLISVNSIEELEDIYLNTIFFKSSGTISQVTMDISFNLQINKLSNNIAMCSRRGAGDTVLLNTNTEQKLISVIEEMYQIQMPHTETLIYGKWKKTYWFQGINYWACDDFPEDKAIVLFHGTHKYEGPILCLDNNGLSYYLNDTGSMTDYRNYTRIIEIV